jgi:hypothetical protein
MLGKKTLAIAALERLSILIQSYITEYTTLEDLRGREDIPQRPLAGLHL